MGGAVRAKALPEALRSMEISKILVKTVVMGILSLLMGFWAADMIVCHGNCVNRIRGRFQRMGRVEHPLQAPRPLSSAIG